MKKVAIILAGCGYLDGAEIRESVLTYLALSKHKDVEIDTYAPNENQHHTVNHLIGEETKVQRNILEESARIARGKVKDLKDLNESDYVALLLPGGFGVAKNLSKFAFKGSAGEINKLYAQNLRSFYNSKKPIGAICISPAVIALELGNENIEVTIGNDKETAQELEKTGAKHVDKNANEFHWDAKNKIASTPAYMYDDANLNDIFIGIQGLVDKVITEI